MPSSRPSSVLIRPCLNNAPSLLFNAPLCSLVTREIRSEVKPPDHKFTMKSLLSYFNRQKEEKTVPSEDDDDTSNKDSEAPSSKVVNEARHLVCLVEERGKSRGDYMKLSLTEKATIGKCASEHGVAAAVKEFDKKNLKESSVRDWRDAYLNDFKQEAKPGEKVVVTALSSKKRGRSVFLGAKLDEHLQHLLVGMRARGTSVGTTVVMGIAEGILMKYKSQFKSGIKLNKEWARSVLCHMGFTKRKANSKSKVLPENFYEIRDQFLTDVRSVIEMEDVPPSMVINWDHTAMKIVPSTNWTMEKKGTKRVEIAGIDDKWQITAVFACAMSGKFLPMQLIYNGTTTKCLPKNLRMKVFHQIGTLRTLQTIGPMRPLQWHILKR